MAPETGFLRESVDKGEVFSSKNPVSLVGFVISSPANYLRSVIASQAQRSCEFREAIQKQSPSLCDCFAELAMTSI
jgi:hypothetical protein